MYRNLGQSIVQSNSEVVPRACVVDKCSAAGGGGSRATRWPSTTCPGGEVMGEGEGGGEVVANAGKVVAAATAAAKQTRRPGTEP